MKPKKIDLLWCKGVYVIVEDPDGSAITNQTDGCCCGHRQTMGYLIPMPRTFDGMLALSKHKDLFDSGKNYLNFPQDGALDKYTEFLLANEFNLAKITSLTEAWVKFTFFVDGEIQTGVLT
jgi:hypothetical protein